MPRPFYIATSSADITNQSQIHFLSLGALWTYLMAYIIHCGLRFLNSALSVNLLELGVKAVAILNLSGYGKPWMVLLLSFLSKKGKLCQLQSYHCLSLFLAPGKV